MNNRRRLVIAVSVVLALVAGLAVWWPLYRTLSAGSAEAGPAVRDASYSELAAKLKAGGLDQVVVYGSSSVAATAKGGQVLRSMMPERIAADFAEQAVLTGIKVEFSSEEFIPYKGGDVTAKTVLAVAGNLAILGALAAFLYMYVVRGAMGGRSRARLAKPADSKSRFADVAGCDAEKLELQEVVEFLRDPGRFSRLGGRVPAGVLMSGPPGTGKTLLARAVAGEAGVPFFSASGSDFVEMYVGVGASRVRGMFAQAKKRAPCILFIDEIDAIGRSRSSGLAGGAHEEREQTLNQLLVEMDGFTPNCGVVVIAATNRPEILDAALTRPGRLSRHVALSNPDIGGRQRILAVHAAKIRLGDQADLAVVARGTPGFSGADLANLVNEAAILAARHGDDTVGPRHFELAKDRLLMGNERPSLAISEDDRRLTAYHEAGHALVALLCPASDPVHKVTIVPRGQALGMVVRLPERDVTSLRRSKLEADLAVAMGGRAAEEIIFGEDDVSTGASGDILMATRLARRMVMEWGMSEKVGMIACLDPHEGNAPVSDHTAREIDGAVRALVEQGRDRAARLLEDYLDELHLLAETLLERESLSGEELAQLVARSRREPVAVRA